MIVASQLLGLFNDLFTDFAGRLTYLVERGEALKEWSEKSKIRGIGLTLGLIL